MATQIIVPVAPYGAAYTGLSIGYTLFNPNGTVYQAHTTAGVVEINGTGIYLTSLSLDANLAILLVWDAPIGVDPYIREIEPNYSAQIYTIESRLVGIVMTGSVAASPTPTSSSFTVTLDESISGSALANDIVGLYVTFRSGAREPSFQKITGCTITIGPPSTLALTTNAFASAPSPGDLILISG